MPSPDPTPIFTPEQAERSSELLHAIQSGNAAREGTVHGDDMRPKHLRTGIDHALVQVGALTQLLVDKGILTAGEAASSYIKAMEEEVHRAEAELSRITGKQVRLG